MTAMVMASKMFSKNSTSSPDLSGSRLRYGDISSRRVLMPLYCESFFLFAGPDWRRIARSSAAYCLFCETGDSSLMMRVRSQGRRAGPSPSFSERFFWEHKLSNIATRVN